MNSTALGAKKENINFISEAHEKFYYEKIQKVREADVYHKALCPTVRKQIGKTTYIVRVHFSQTAKETMEDKIKRLLREEVRKM